MKDPARLLHSSNCFLLLAELPRCEATRGFTTEWQNRVAPSCNIQVRFEREDATDCGRAVVVGQLLQLRAVRAICPWRLFHEFEEFEEKSRAAPVPGRSNAAFEQRRHENKLLRRAASGSHVAALKRAQVSLSFAADSQATVGRRGSCKPTKKR